MLFAQTSRLLNHILSLTSDPVNLEFSALLWRLSAGGDEHINIAEQSSAELHKQLKAIWIRSVNSVPVIRNSPRYPVPPTVLGYPGFLSELPGTDLKEPSRFLAIKAMAVT